MIAVVLAAGDGLPPVDLNTPVGLILLVALDCRLVRDRLLDPALHHRPARAVADQARRRPFDGRVRERRRRADRRPADRPPARPADGQPARPIQLAGCRSTTVIATGLGMMGLTVAKRHDLAEAARSYGLLKVAEVDPDRRPLGGTTDLRRHQCADRRPHDRRRRLRLPVGHPRRAALRRRRAAADRRSAATRHVASAGGAASRCFRVLQKDPRIAVELNDEDVAGRRGGRRQAARAGPCRAAPAS